MGEHKMMPIKASLMSPLRSIKLFEDALLRCESEQDKAVVSTLMAISKRECLLYSEDIMRLCSDREFVL